MVTIHPNNNLVVAFTLRIKLSKTTNFDLEFDAPKQRNSPKTLFSLLHPY